MALENPLVSSPGSIMSAISPYTEFSLSPDSPAQASRFQSMYAVVDICGKSYTNHLLDSPSRSSGDSSLHPNSVERRSSPAISSAFSPSDMVGPSPVTSNGTDTTEIEDEDNGEGEVLQPPLVQSEATPSPSVVGPVHSSPDTPTNRNSNCKDSAQQSLNIYERRSMTNRYLSFTRRKDTKDL